MGIAPRLSLVTLGVADVPASERFYRALGWKVVASQDSFRLFDVAGAYPALFPAAELAEDAGLAEQVHGSRIPGCELRDQSGERGCVDAAFALARTS